MQNGNSVPVPVEQLMPSSLNPLTANFPLVVSELSLANMFKWLYPVLVSFVLIVLFHLV